MKNKQKQLKIKEVNKALEEHWKKKKIVHSNAIIKKNDDDTKKGSPLILKQKELFNKLVNEKKEKILNFNKKIDFDNLTYNFKDKRITKIDLNDFDNAINFLKMIGDGKI